VSSLVEMPDLIGEKQKNLYPPNVIQRARQDEKECWLIGAYSHSMGIPFIREFVAKFVRGTCRLVCLGQTLF
jgi:alanine transaminase